jgi:hypothetical protein
MSCRLRVFWLLSLLIFLSGCSGYRLACPANDQDSRIADGDLLSACDLKTGDKIRINLVDGKRVTGEIQSLSNREITLKNETRRNNTVVIPAPDILSIEKEASYTAFRAVGMVLVLGAVVVGGVHIVNNTLAPELKPLDIWGR